MSHTEKTFYLVSYRDPSDGKVVSLKCRTVADSSLGLSFVSLSEFVFSEDSVVVNPTEENLKKKFKNTKALHLSIYSILSIEEVGEDHKGLSFQNDKSNLLVLNPENGSPPN